MSVKYSLVFLILAGGCAAAGVALWGLLTPASLLFIYTAFSFLWVGLAYAGGGPRLLLKSRRGRLHPATWLLLGPYRALTSLSLFLVRATSKEPASTQVGPNLYLGRRLLSAEVRKARPLQWQAVLDLAAEFSEAREFCGLENYRSLPLLDATAPTLNQLREAVGFLREMIPNGPVYVHCALGHGRSATVVLAYLLAVGEAATVKDGLVRLRALRPGVALHRPQVQVLREFLAAP